MIDGVGPDGDSGRRIASFLFVCAPLAIGIPAPFTFAWAGRRLRSKSLAFEAAAYGVIVVGCLTLSGSHGAANSLAGGLLFLVMIVATARAFGIRRQVFPLPPTLQAAAVVVPHSLDFEPTFPAETAEPLDPSKPASWVKPVLCTGSDSHQLSMPLPRTIGPALLGAGIVALDAATHAANRSLGVGIGLLLTPAIAAMFSRRVEGPTLYYRRWGIEHALRLQSVTEVTTTSSKTTSSTVSLNAPGLPRRINVVLRSKTWTLGADARDHLYGWLHRPGVQFAPAALRLLTEGPLPISTGSRRRGLRIVLVGISFCASLVALGIYLFGRTTGSSLAIPGAPGYFTVSGPKGDPLPVGRPWGTSCQPAVFTVTSAMPASVYSLVLGVILTARASGVDVAITNLANQWEPASLYPSGLTAAQVKFVPIAVNLGTPPTLSNGSLEHVGFGWDARPAADGTHEILTNLQTALFLQPLQHNPLALRHAVREIVAFSQGIGSSSLSSSAIGDQTAVDTFTPVDLAAMATMSGCATSAP